MKRDSQIFKAPETVSDETVKASSNHGKSDAFNSAKIRGHAVYGELSERARLAYHASSILYTACFQNKLRKSNPSTELELYTTMSPFLNTILAQKTFFFGLAKTKALKMAAKVTSTSSDCIIVLSPS